MTKEKLMQLHEDASNGITRPNLAANLLSEVCETALELFKIVEQQKAQIDKYQRARSLKYVPE
jgi:hypothetical protein